MFQKITYYFSLLTLPLLATETTQTQIDEYVLPYIEKHKLPGLAIAIVQDGKTTVYCYGVQDKETLNPITPDTIFEIGSVTKVFTATALALQVVQGNVKLEDSISNYLPALQTGGKIHDVTLLELATHTSSLPRLPPKSDKTKEQILRFVNHWKPAHAIGTHYLYSNLAFGLLGFALENLEQKSYESVIEDDINIPLNMTSTMVQVKENLKNHLATGYSIDNRRINAPWKVVWKGAGALRSTPNDLAKFVEGNLKLRGTDTLNQAMQLAQKEFFKVNDTLSLGLAWQRVPRNDVLIIDKNGAVPGFSTYIGFIPEKGVGVAILCNKRHKGITEFGRQILLTR